MFSKSSGCTSHQTLCSLTHGAMIKCSHVTQFAMQNLLLSHTCEFGILFDTWAQIAHLEARLAAALSSPIQRALVNKPERRAPNKVGRRSCGRCAESAHHV